MDDLLLALKGAAEPTRLRLLAVLARCELTVGELCRVVGQSQPRVSRHLRLLCEAGLLDRHPQGTSAFYRPTRDGEGRRLFDALLPLLDLDDPTIARDLERLTVIRAERADAAAEYFESIASDWDRMRDLHVADAEVEAMLRESVDDLRVRDLLDIGTGTGRVLEVFADRIDHGLGIDLSREMLDLARSRLDQRGLTHCGVRHGNIYELDLPAGSIDVATLHHVLHFLDDPARAIAEAARSLRPHGRLLIVDFAQHGYERLRDEHAHHWLGFSDEEVAEWCENAGLLDVVTTHLTPTTELEPLTVTLWVARQRSDAPSLLDLEVAS